MKTLIIQLSILFGVTLLITIFSSNHYLGFILGLFGQIALYNMYLQLVEVFVTVKAKELDVQLATELSAQGLEVECPCAKKAKAFVPIRLNENNGYKCPACDKDIRVIITADTALVTVPLANTDVSDPANYKIDPSLLT